MSPKKEELWQEIERLKKLNSDNIKISDGNENILRSRVEERDKTIKKRDDIITELRSEIAKLKAEIAQLAINQNNLTIESPASSNEEPMPLGSPNSPSQNKENPAKKEPAPPPITVSGVVNFDIFQNSILQNLTEGVHYPVFITQGNGDIKIKAACAGSHRQIIHLLSEMQKAALTQPDNLTGNIEFYCYKLKQDRDFCFIIRNLHPSIDVARIKQALYQQGYKVKNIINLRRRVKTNDGYSYRQLPLHRVEIESTEHNKEVFEIKELLYTKVVIETPRKTVDIPQCSRCQQLGHTKNYCAKKVRCVKCAGNHLTKDCKKTIDTKPTCANCGGEHPANYKGCPVYKVKQEAMFPKKKKNLTQRMQDKQHQSMKPVTPNLSYAQAAKSGKPATSAADSQGQSQPNQQQGLRPAQSQKEKPKQQQQRQPTQQWQRQTRTKMTRTQEQPGQQQDKQKEPTIADIIAMLTIIQRDLGQLNQRVSTLEIRSPQQQPKRKRDD